MPKLIAVDQILVTDDLYGRSQPLITVSEAAVGLGARIKAAEAEHFRGIENQL